MVPAGGALRGVAHFRVRGDARVLRRLVREDGRLALDALRVRLEAIERQLSELVPIAGVILNKYDLKSESYSYYEYDYM